MVAAISFSAWILPYIGNGPQWGPLIEENSNLCQQSFWKNIFFVQNFFPVQEQCSPHLQQIAIDCQLFLVAPIVVYYLKKNAIVGFGLFGSLNAFSVAMRYSSALSERLSFVVFQGMKWVRHPSPQPKINGVKFLDWANSTEHSIYPSIQQCRDLRHILSAWCWVFCCPV